ncbi:MAG: hypothetical protein ACXW2Y_08015, partial [Acidimicrobiia bacterium]
MGAGVRLAVHDPIAIGALFARKLRTALTALVPEVRHVHNTNRCHRPAAESEAEFTQFLLDDLEQAILAIGPETVCLVHMEPVQNAGGCLLPPDDQPGDCQGRNPLARRRPAGEPRPQLGSGQRAALAERPLSQTRNVRWPSRLGHRSFIRLV